jgi:hypothetical protein
VPDLSPECIERLRTLDGQLGSVLLTINARAIPGEVRSLNLIPAQKLELINFLEEAKSPPHIGDDECQEIFRGIEPKIGNLIESISKDHSVDIIGFHLEEARLTIQSNGIGI